MTNTAGSKNFAIIDVLSNIWHSSITKRGDRNSQIQPRNIAMQTIQAKVQINADRTLTVQLPAEIQTGEYEVELILKSRAPDESQTSEPDADGRQKSSRAKAWEKWIKAVEELPISPGLVVESDYQQHIIEKYRKQGLEV